MDSLKRLQYIDRKQDELSQQQRELARLGEQEKLQGELSVAEAIQKILQEPDRPDEMEVTSSPADSRPLFYRNASQEDNVDAVTPNAPTQFPAEGHICHPSLLDINTPTFVPDSEVRLPPADVPLQPSPDTPYPTQPHTDQFQLKTQKYRGSKCNY